MFSICAMTALLAMLVILVPSEVLNFNIEDMERIDFLEDNTGELFVTVSATNKFKVELNWNLSKVCDEIRLYLHQPPYDNIKPNVMLKPFEKEGYFITNESFSIDDLPFHWKKESPGFNLTKGPINLDYCVAAVENKQIIKTNCLKIEPTWMKNNGDIIGGIPLTELMIPGTHNSGCYGDYPHLDIKDPVFKYIYTQDTDIWTQLVFGIRYLDVRVGYYNTTFVRDSFWVNHDKFKVNLLKDLFRELKVFLARAKDEIVILDLHRFPVGFKNPERHKQLTALIDTELGDIAIPRSYQKPPKGPTLNELWAQNGRLIICYGDTATAIINGGKMEQVNMFEYFGKMLSRNGRIDREIERWVFAWCKILGALGPFARNVNVSRGARLRMYSWMKKHEQRITAVKMKHLREALKHNTRKDSNYLWDPLTQKWGNKQRVEELKQYLQEIRSNHDSKNSNKLWASMAELTATPASILGGLLSFANSFRSLAHMSDNVNRNLNTWYRYSPCDVNIVATDYFLGNDLINIALECNLRKGIK